MKRGHAHEQVGNTTRKGVIRGEKRGGWTFKKGEENLEFGWKVTHASVCTSGF